MTAEKLLVEAKVLKVVLLAAIEGNNEVGHQGAIVTTELMHQEVVLLKKGPCANIRRQKEINRKERKERKEDRDEFFSLFWFARKFSVSDSAGQRDDASDLWRSHGAPARDLSPYLG